jgi:calcineurin-like phosphoesterase family protein
MATWFTADLHFGHERIIELCNRPFSNVDEMNTELIHRWNSYVDQGDSVYVLGDVAMGKIAETLPLVEQLRGTKYLVPGNHDRCWPGHKKVRPADIEAYKHVGFKILGPQHVYGRWLLCHFPQAGDSHDRDRYVDHRPQLTGYKAIIHGHVHNQWKVNARQINVGVDVWGYTPVHLNQLRELIDSLSG